MEPTEEARARRRWVSAAKILFQLVVLLLVAWGIWRTVNKAVRDLEEQQASVRTELVTLEAELAELERRGAATHQVESLRVRKRYLQSQQFSLWQIRPGWLTLAALLYVLSMVPSWIFWHRTLRAMGQHPEPLRSLRAFCVGHLGKYVPGKAMVVILRTGLVRGRGVDATVAATSVFVETLTLMAVGGLVSAAILAALFRNHWQLLLWALLMMVVSGVPTLPPVFRRLVRLLKIASASQAVGPALEGLNYRLIAWGWLLMLVTWSLTGLSLWAVMLSLPGQTLSSQGLADVMLMTATAALAVVVGFLSFIPGGFGVREVVVMTLLAESRGGVVAIVGAVLLRLVWLLAEVLVSVILYVGFGRRTEQPLHS